MTTPRAGNLPAHPTSLEEKTCRCSHAGAGKVPSVVSFFTVLHENVSSGEVRSRPFINLLVHFEIRMQEIQLSGSFLSSFDARADDDVVVWF